MGALRINTLHPTSLYTVLIQSQENDPFEKITLLGVKHHLFSSAWWWQHNLWITCGCCKLILLVYVPDKLKFATVWSCTVCSLELKTVHFQQISFPHPSGLKKTKLNKHPRLKFEYFVIYSHVLVTVSCIL